ESRQLLDLLALQPPSERQLMDSLGVAYYHLWCSTWESRSDLTARLQAAMESSPLAAASIQSLLIAHSAAPDWYRAGTELIMMASLLEDLVKRTGLTVPPLSLPPREKFLQDLRQRIERGINEALQENLRLELVYGLLSRGELALLFDDSSTVSTAFR